MMTSRNINSGHNTGRIRRHWREYLRGWNWGHIPPDDLKKAFFWTMGLRRWIFLVWLEETRFGRLKSEYLSCILQVHKNIRYAACIEY